MLWKGKNLRQISYDSAPLRFSDHRPVYAEFQIKVNVVDEVLKEQLSLELYKQRRNEVGNATANKKSDDLDDEDLIGYDPIEPGLPPASSDRRKWWLENGQDNHACILVRSDYDLQVFLLDRISNPQDQILCPTLKDPRIHSLQRMNLIGLISHQHSKL